MSTIRDLISGSLRLIEELGAGQTASAEDCADGLSAFNAMLSSWSIQGDLVYTETNETFSLTSGTASYTIGSGGTFSTTRPTKIVAVTVNNGIDNPVDIIGEAEYAAIANKTAQGVPSRLYYDGNYPLGTIKLWPVPTTGQTITLYSEKPLSSYTSISDTLVAPEGYERAFRFNLAVEMAPEFGKEAKASVQSIAIESKNTIMNQNNLNDLDTLRADAALLRNKSFSIVTG